MMDIFAVIYIELINLLKNCINRNSGTHIRFQLILILFKGNIILPIQKKVSRNPTIPGKNYLFAPLLEKVCKRLFENSVMHGYLVTRIRVWHTASPDGVTIFFEDDGIGIPQEQKEQIFLHSEGPRASMRSLIFVREILDITGITISETGEPGKGARFEMTVPKGAWRFGAVQ